MSARTVQCRARPGSTSWKAVVAGMAITVLMLSSARADAMRNPLLNDLRGFDIACRTKDAAESQALCAAIKRLLEKRFAKPVTVSDPATLPLAPSALPVPNRVWMVVGAAAEGAVTRLEATWGSSMRMAGVAEQESAESVRVPAGAAADIKADAILANTPFRAN